MNNFSIIIPVVEINDYVLETAQCILNFENNNWELIVVTNSNSSNLWKDPRIKVVTSGRAGPADKRDIAAKISAGNILVFLDDDSYPNNDLLKIAELMFADPDVIALGGPAITPKENNLWQKVSGASFLSSFNGGFPERYISSGLVREVDDWPSVNLMVRKNVFLQVGGFDCKYWPGEDTKLCLKLRRLGKKILYVPQMMVWHHRRANIFTHLKQVGAYGFHRGFFAKRYPETSLRIKYFIPSLFVLFACFTALLVYFGNGQIAEFMKIIVIIGWLLYCIALGASVFQVAKHEKWSVALLTIFYTVPTHLYYGIKFMYGYFKKGPLISKLR